MQRRILRLLYTSVATPAALVAIASGRFIFLWQGPLAPWLVVKLAVVALVVLMHATAVFGASLAGRSTIAWLVLSKPVP